MRIIIFLLVFNSISFAQDSLYWFDMSKVRDPIPSTPKVLDNVFGTSQLNVIDSLKNDCITPPVSAFDSIQTTRFVHAIYRSDELKSWVHLKDNPISTRLGK